MSTLTIAPEQSIAGKARAFTGRTGVQRVIETILVSDEDMRPTPDDGGWTQEEFAIDLKNAQAKTHLKDAIREAREDYREGRAKPFPER